MDIHVFLAFVVATSIMIALPGPSVILTVAHSISFGWRPAIATVAGETMGIAVQLLVAAIGLASLLHVVAFSTPLELSVVSSSLLIFMFSLNNIITSH